MGCMSEVGKEIEVDDRIAALLVEIAEYQKCEAAQDATIDRLNDENIRMTAEIEQLRSLLVECCEDDAEGPHFFGENLWQRLRQFQTKNRPQSKSQERRFAHQLPNKEPGE